METLVSQQNFYLGCRVCRRMLASGLSVFFFDAIPDIGMKYAEAFSECVELEVSLTLILLCFMQTNNSLFLGDKKWWIASATLVTWNLVKIRNQCSTYLFFSPDCAAKLTIAFQFKKDAAESARILKRYSEVEKSENDIYENAKLDTAEGEEEFFEYETLEELDESSQDSKKEVFEQVSTEGGNAVSFLTGILKPSGRVKKFDVKKVSPKKVNDAGFDDPNRKHVCNVCNKKFQKRSNLIDHLRLHANVKVFSCEVSDFKNSSLSFLSIFVTFQYCEKSFVQAGNYKAHIRTHTKEKPYACHFCNKSYSQSSSLKIHIRWVFLIEIFVRVPTNHFLL